MLTGGYIAINGEELAMEGGLLEYISYPQKILFLNYCFL
jgi:hypothetical protein